MSKPIWSRSKNNFGPMVEERGIKNNPNSYNFKYFETFKIVIATHHENRERSKLCTGAYVKGGGHCVLKWGFTRTFPRNQDTTLK